MFNEYPNWHSDTRDVERRWRVPVAVQMAIIYQESKFQARAKTPHKLLLGFIPWSHVSSAYGYSQALDGTWALYRKNNGNIFSSRSNFSDAVDFIGWYSNMAHKRAGIRADDAYSLYLAYHEGVLGYMRKTYLKKPWLIKVAHKVAARAVMYKAQLAHCK
jgi:hypothetical protein